MFTPEALTIIRKESQAKELNEAVYFSLHNVMTQLDKKKIYVSPRRWIKIRQVIQMVAHTSHVARPVCLSDCAILKHLTWNRHTQIDDIFDIFLHALETTLQLFPEHIDTVEANLRSHFWITPEECAEIMKVCEGLQRIPRIHLAPHPLQFDNLHKTFVNETQFNIRARVQQPGFVPTDMIVRNFVTSQSALIGNYFLVGIKQQTFWHKIAVHIDPFTTEISARVLSPIYHPHVSADGVVYCLELEGGGDAAAKFQKMLIGLKTFITSPSKLHLEVMKNMTSSPTTSEAALVLLQDPQKFQANVRQFNDWHVADLQPTSEGDVATNKNFN